MMKILVVDDHILFREGLVNLLSTNPEFEIVGEAASVIEAVEKTKLLNPDIVLMDINLPDGRGHEAVKQIIAHQPDMKIVMLTVHESDELLFEAIRLGAKGYLLKNTPVAKLLLSLRSMEKGEPAMTRSMSGRIIQEFARMGRVMGDATPELDVLSARELQILRFLGEDSSNQDIASNLFISHNTVKVHVHNILEKLHMKNRSQAARFAKRLGLVNNKSLLEEL